MNSSNKEKSPPYPDDEWSRLACAAQGGDKKAYSRLLKALIPFLKSVLVPRLANPDWADDVTQDVLISVHKSLATYSRDRPFRPWLMAIVNFRRTDFLRKHYSAKTHKNVPLDNADFMAAHVTNPAHAGEYKDIEQALSALPKKQQKVFRLVRIEGYSMKEAAKEMNMSVSAVKVSAHRTMKKLKDQLG